MARQRFNELFVYECYQYRCMMRYLDNLFGKQTEFEDFTDENLQKFSTYIRKRYSEGTCRSYLGALRAFLNKHKELVPSKKFSTILNIHTETETNAKNFMSYSDMLKIESYIPDDVYEKEARIIFLIMSYTGASYQDAISFTIYNINDNTGCLFYTSEKHNVDITIKAHENLKSLILEKTSISKTSLPSFLNKKLKSLFEKAGVTEENSEGKRKCDVVNFTVAQKTFATRLYHKGVSLEDIQSLLGLKNKKNVKNYVISFIPKKRTSKKALENAIVSL